MAEMDVLDDVGSVRKVALKGRLDIQGVSQVELRFNATVCPKAKPTVLDFSGVTFLSSMGIRMLISAARTMANKGARMVILSPQDLVRDTIVGASLEGVLPIAASEEEALRLLGST